MTYRKVAQRRKGKYRHKSILEAMKQALKEVKDVLSMTLN
jgi:hypothetical protein